MRNGRLFVLPVMAFLVFSPASWASTTGDADPPQTGQPTSVEEAVEEGVSPAYFIDEDVLARVREATDLLGAAESFHVVADISYDVRQDWGQHIEFGTRRTVTLQRPGKVRIEFESREGHRGKMIFAGGTVYLFDEIENVYAEISGPEALEGAEDLIVDELNIPVPLLVLLRPDAYEQITEELKSALYVGDEILDGEQVEHFAFRNDETDFQIWVASGGQPFIRRVVINYRFARGQPQFRASLTGWDLAPEITEDIFTFTPPDGAERIDVLARISPDDQAEGDVQ